MAALMELICSLIFLILLFLIADGMGAFGGKWRARNFLMNWFNSTET
jgi:hypothetical protein